MGTVFVPRGGPKVQLEQTLANILTRTKKIEEEGIFPPLAIFPEGTCTNNTCLLKFKRGAFFDLRTVIPVTVKYKFGMVSPAIDALEMSYTSFLLSCALQTIVAEVKILPAFQPNDYLFT